MLQLGLDSCSYLFAKFCFDVLMFFHKIMFFSLGHSHQLFHICGILATNEQMNGILADFRENQHLALEKKNPAAFGWSLGAVVVVMAFCLVVVAVNTWRMSQYDEDALDKLLMHLHHCNNTLLLHLPRQGEALYLMAQRKCETIRQRFRSRSGTPVKTALADSDEASKKDGEKEVVEPVETLTVVVRGDEEGESVELSVEPTTVLSTLEELDQKLAMSVRDNDISSDAVEEEDLRPESTAVQTNDMPAGETHDFESLSEHVHDESDNENGDDPDARCQCEAEDVADEEWKSVVRNILQVSKSDVDLNELLLASADEAEQKRILKLKEE